MDIYFLVIILILLVMIFRRFSIKGAFGIRNKNITDTSNVLYIHEDDFLMIELVPVENLDFIKKETERIRQFGEENFDGTAFTGLTEIQELPIKTLSKKILLKEIAELLINNGFARHNNIRDSYDTNVNRALKYLAYGNHEFAVILNEKDDFVKHIWFTSDYVDQSRQKGLRQFLLEMHSKYGFMAVNWYQEEWYLLDTDNSINQFIEVQLIKEPTN